MKVISNGDRNKVYCVKCPYCGAIIQAEAWEFHHFKGMYDEPLVEPNHTCPNCNRYFSMLKWDFEKCYVGDGLYPDEKKNILYESLLFSRLLIFTLFSNTVHRINVKNR